MTHFLTTSRFGFRVTADWTLALVAISAVWALGDPRANAGECDQPIDVVSPQPPGICGGVLTNPIDSGFLDNVASQAVSVFAFTIPLGSQTAWMRILFAEAALPSGSVLRVTSLQDGEQQELDATEVARWSGGTAFFNGSCALLELVAGPNTTGNRVRIERILTGLSSCGNFEVGICDETGAFVDDRMCSNDPRVLRMVPMDLVPAASCTGCPSTAFLIDVPCGMDDRLHVTSHHSLHQNPGPPSDSRNGDVLPESFAVQLNVPLSRGDCAMQHPAIRDQFPVDRSAVITGGNGANDSGVFRCHPNSEGQTSLQRIRQLVPGVNGFAIAAIPTLTDPPPQLRVTGYGVDSRGPGLDPSPNEFGCGGCQPQMTTGCNLDGDLQAVSLNHVQQSSTGPLAYESGGHSPGWFGFRVDVCVGNSGGPTIVGQPDPDDSLTGGAAGIVVANLCGIDGFASESVPVVGNPALSSAICHFADPSVTANGARYLALGPFLGSSPFAIRVTSPNRPFPAKYVQSNGALCPTPFYSASWPALSVIDAEIIPGTWYRIEKVSQTPGLDESLGFIASWLWGDIFPRCGDGLVDVDDLLCALDAFSGNPGPGCTLLAADLAPCCLPDGLLDVDDLLGLLDAFRGIPFACEGCLDTCLP